MLNNNFLESVDWDRIDQLTWVPINEELEKSHRYFSLVKILPQEQFTVWKLLKNAMQSINEIRSNGRSAEEETRHWITLDACASIGLCDEIKGELVLAKYRNN